MSDISSSEDTTDNLELFKLLECPVCFKTMVAPILLCTNGHNICNDCKDEISQCPLCTGEYTGIRNRLAEELADTLPFPCPNAEAGCSVKIQRSQVEKHGVCCPYRVYKCLLSTCEWSRRNNEILAHFNNTHKDYVKTGNLNFVLSEDDIDKGKKKCHLVPMYGEIFWCVTDVNLEAKTVLWQVQFIGPEGRASEFVYQLLIKNDDSGSINVSRVTHSDLLDANSITNSRNCVELGFKFVNFFTTNKYRIEFDFNIIKKGSLLPS